MVAADDAGDEDGEVEDAKYGFKEGYRAYLARDGGDSGSAKFRDGAEAEVDEVEAVGDVVEIGYRVQVEGVWLDADDRAVDAGEGEAEEDVDGKGAEDGFGGCMPFGVDVAKDDGKNDEVEGDAEQAAGDDGEAGVRRGEQDPLQESWDGEAEDQNKEFATEADGLDGEQKDGAAEDAEGVVAEPAALGVGVDGDREEEKEEEHSEAVAGGGGAPAGAGSGGVEADLAGSCMRAQREILSARAW